MRSCSKNRHRGLMAGKIAMPDRSALRRGTADTPYPELEPVGAIPGSRGGVVLEGVEHGTPSAYAKGCSCVDCRAANVAKSRKRLAKRSVRGWRVSA